MKLSCFKKEINQYSDEKYQYIDKLKQLIIDDEKENGINYNVATEGFFEFKNEFKNNNNKDTNNYFFTLGGYRWCLSFLLNNKIFLKNYVNDNKNPALAKFVVSFREYDNYSDFKTLNVSSLYWFNNKGYKNGYYLNKNSDGYLQEINSKLDLKFNKPLVKKNTVMIGIYLRIYEKSPYDIYSDFLRKDVYLMNINYNSDFKKSTIYERVIEDWISYNYSYCFNEFEFGGVKWLLRLVKKNSNFSFNLSVNLKSFKKHLSNVCCSVIFYIRNENDFSCINLYPYYRICNLNYSNNMVSCNNCFNEYDIFIYDNDKSILEGKGLVYGVYLTLY